VKEKQCRVFSWGHRIHAQRLNERERPGVTGKERGVWMMVKHSAARGSFGSAQPMPFDGQVDRCPQATGTFI
jgi:hypothetical protein